MAHGYKTLHRWNQWLTEPFLGPNLLEKEADIISQMLEKHYGKHSLLIGVPNQNKLQKKLHLNYTALISPITDQNPKINHIESDFYHLPIITGGIDLVILPHILELFEHPRQLLAEACRIIKPEGLIVICGFNPYGLWRLRKKYSVKNKSMPWTNQFIHTKEIKNWLELLDFKLEQQYYGLFTLPINHPKLSTPLNWLEKMGTKYFPIIGGIYILIARAKILPLTPIRLKWKQEFGGVRVPTRISGTIAH